MTVNQIDNKHKEENIQIANFNNVIKDKYLEYAISTIMSRSLPDVRDGLKPVHRRLLYAMLKLKLDPKNTYKKCARIVGDVIGKYHPHGDTAVYDTLVRMAQSFSLRYPLIDGQGNFGSIDGDNAAAMRYTESKLTNVALLMMQDLYEDTVDFGPNYDESETEPLLLPSRFPNLLANGSEGIAVGMATNIPPHNLNELCDALIYIIDHESDNKVDNKIDKEENSDITTADLMKFIKGPDFPSGGVIIDNKEKIEENYTKGRGSFTLRAKWHKETHERNCFNIVITEIPYQIQKSKIIQQIATLIKDKKLPLINNIREESAEDIRIVIEPKNRSVEPEMLMEALFKFTSLQTKFHLNLNVLNSDSVPGVMNLYQILSDFLSHRKNIILRRSNFKINKIEDRLEILEALKIAYLNIDDVIKIIRFEDNPKQKLIEKYDLSENAADAILNIRLRSLQKLEEHAINKEFDQLSKELKNLKLIISNKKKLYDVIKSEIIDVKSAIGDDRRTNIEEAVNIINLSELKQNALINKEPISFICSKMGWVYNLKGHNINKEDLIYKTGDKENVILEIYNTDYLLIFSDSGKCFSILANNIVGNKLKPESLKILLSIDEGDEITNIIKYQKDSKLLLASTDGKGFIVQSNDLISKVKSGKQIMQLKNNSKLCVCKEVLDQDTHVAIVGNNRKLIIFSIDEIPILKKGSGVILQKYKGAMLSDIKLFSKEEGLNWKYGSKMRSETNLDSWIVKRGAIGKIPPYGFPKNNKFC